MIYSYFSTSSNTCHIVNINKSTFACNRVSILSLIDVVLLTTIIVSYLTIIIISFWRFRKLLFFSFFLFISFIYLICIVISSSPWNIIGIKVLGTSSKLFIFLLICILITFFSIIILLNLPCGILISQFFFIFESPMFIRLVPCVSTCLLTAHLNSTSASVAR